MSGGMVCGRGRLRGRTDREGLAAYLPDLPLAVGAIVPGIATVLLCDRWHGDRHRV